MDFSRGEPVSPSALVIAELRQHRTVPEYTGGMPDEEGVFMEKDLARDAPWKRIQQNTFTRWANEHLKTVHLGVRDLETDFSDGLLLIALVEVLSGRRLPKHTKKPVFRSQKLENVSVALTFLEEEEGLKLVSIDSTDIVDGRLKLILGLVWALILHYSLSKPKWEGDPDSDGPEKKLTPKQRLITWFHHKMPQLPISNFTTDWNDGRACGALDNAVAPGLCPDWKDWDPRDALRNATEAMSLAEKWLGVPQLISPEDMIDPNIDEQSMMTYLAQFPIAKVKADAPLRTPTTRKPSQLSVRSSVVTRPDLVKCSGRGIQADGIRTGDVVNIRMATGAAGLGDVDLSIMAPDGSLEKYDMQTSENLYEAYYCPSLEGRYVISILYGGRHVPRSPFQVNVKPAIASNIRVYGPGLSAGAVGYPANLYVDMNGEAGMLSFLIEGPSEVKIDCKDRDLVAYATYWPTCAGEYAVHIHCDNEDIHGSPFMAEISQLPAGVNPDKVRVELPLREGVAIGQPVEMVVRTRDAGNAPLEVLVTDGEFDVLVKKEEVEPGVWRFVFTPDNAGMYVVLVNFAGVAVGGSPFNIPVRSSTAVGPSLLSPRSSRSNDNFLSSLEMSSLRIIGFQPNVALNTLSEFLVDCRDAAVGDSAALKVFIHSPSGISGEALVSEKSPGLYNVSCSVFEEGPHTLSMSLDGLPVRGQPLIITAGNPSGNYSLLKNSNGLAGGQKTEDYSVSEEMSGDGTTIIRRETRLVRETVSSVCTESILGSSTSSVLNGVPSAMAALELAQGDASKVVLVGEGVQRARVNQVNTFTVRADAAGYNVLLVGVYGKILNAHEVKMTYKGQATYEVTYELKERGEYLLIVKYGDDHVNGSPFILQCQ